MTVKAIRQFLVVSFTFLGGLYFFLEFVTPKFLLPETVAGFSFEIVHTKISQAVILVGAMAIGLGVINLLRVHGGAIVRGRKGRINSVALLLGLFVVFGIETADFLNAETRINEWQRLETLRLFYNHIEKSVPQAARDEKRALIIDELAQIEQNTENRESFLFIGTDDEAKKAGEKLLTAIKTAKTILNEETLQQAIPPARELTQINYNKTKAKKANHFFFTAFFVPLGSAMFSLLAFYVATAAYRTFRVKSLEAFIMMSVAIVVMLGQIPHGPIYISEDLPDIRNWVLKNISTPAFRAIAFGSAIAALAMAMRMWLSLEKSPLAVEDDKG